VVRDRVRKKTERGVRRKDSGWRDRQCRWWHIAVA